MFKKLIGTKDFYRHLLTLAIPIMIQNGVTNFVNMLDNIMVGSVGTVEMTGVAVTNQLFFVFSLCIFGAVSGVGIFGAQYVGAKDHEGLRYTFRFKIIFCTALTLFSIGIFVILGDFLIGLYLKGEGDPSDAIASLGFAKQYMYIMFAGLLPATLVQCYSSTLRETGQTFIPMVASLVAVATNLILDYILIFGKFGFPKLGVAGAAIATVIARFIEFGILFFWTFNNRHKKESLKFICGAYKSLYVPRQLIGRIVVKGFPLLFNETFWAAGLATISQCYSTRGLDVVAANNIANTFFHVVAVACFAVGGAIGIILGQQLGAGDIELARETAPKLIFFSFLVSVVVCAIFCVIAIYAPALYNTTPEIRLLATRFMQIIGLIMPAGALANSMYFTLRSGGRTYLTILFDSGFVWLFCVTTAYFLSRFTTIEILPMFFIIQALTWLKVIFSFPFVKKGIWLKNIIN
ncbi:MAG: MATE family efflux transporter [Ruminococcaceae bacterium]|nr:MATE family efflux transporter [Oscillospiraceae bacterium]